MDEGAEVICGRCAEVSSDKECTGELLMGDAEMSNGWEHRGERMAWGGREGLETKVA